MAIFFKEIDHFTSQFVEIRSEYKAKEQLSKFTLLIIVVLALKCLSHQKDDVLLKLSMGYLIFIITMYLSESNMIKEKLQPVFAAILIPMLFHEFFKKKTWLSLSFFVVGLGVIALGVTRDFAVKHQAVADIMPAPLFYLTLKFDEEMLDVVGIGFIGLSALTLFYSSLQKFAQQGLAIGALLIIGVMLVSIGNGLSHYQYRPSTLLWLVGLAMTLGGAGAFTASEYLADDEKLFVHSPYKNYLFLSFFFIFLPSFISKYTYLVGLALWLIVVFTSRNFYYSAKTHNNANHARFARTA